MVALGVQQKDNKYYRISVHGGHMGRGKSKDIVFYIQAPTMIAATNHARKMPGVKHTRPVIFAQEISRDEYMAGRQISAYER